ncbi:hypothetical protein CB1_001254016 [Camelus ferus]|nr:hypothetical protein CB1_001254016 [Camelus ferus]
MPGVQPQFDIRQPRACEQQVLRPPCTVSFRTLQLSSEQGQSLIGTECGDGRMQLDWQLLPSRGQETPISYCKALISPSCPAVFPASVALFPLIQLLLRVSAGFVIGLPCGGQLLLAHQLSRKSTVVTDRTLRTGRDETVFGSYEQRGTGAGPGMDADL